MKKQFEYFILSLLVFILFSVDADAQTKRSAPVKEKTAPAAKFQGVYAGLQLTYGFGGMETYTYAYYFRPDGTYATEFDEPDWKTRVDGTFTVKGKIITLLKKGETEPDTMEITDDRHIDDGFVLSKFEFTNAVPAKRLENKFASGSGGIATGGAVPYVGVFSNRVFNFDGRGNFTNDSQSTVAVSGDNIGGGSSKNNSGSGTYTIKDSVLTLKYPDGTTVTKSFFYKDGSRPGEEIAALIDGRFYFDYDDVEESAVVEKKKETAKAPLVKAPSVTTTAPDAASVLKAANAVHGGARLDNLKTLKLTGKLTGASGAVNYDVVILYDFVRQRNRNELAQNGKLDTVEQLDGAASFSWTKGRKSPLSEARTAEMKQGFSTGIFGLRGDVLKSVKATSISIDQEKNLKTVKVLIGGKEYGWLFDAENRLIVEASTEDNQQRLDLSEDFRAVSGVLLPFSNASQIGSLILELNLSAVEVNPNLTEKDWALPR